jgi:thiamine-phosphate pyrophosphorylase
MDEGGVFLSIGPGTADETLVARLGRGDVACVSLRDPTTAAIDRLRPLVQDRDIAFIVEGDAVLAARTGCDGVRVEGSDAYAAARRAVGKDAIVGVHVGESRHEAMVAGEDGADFIAFAADVELVAWWTELMEVPCVAPVEGADFVEETLA